MHLLALDTETCALGAGRDHVVQFCAVALDGELREQGRWTELVNPGRPIPPHATAVHGITDTRVRHAPPFARFAPRLRSLVAPDTVLVAYNAPFDIGVLNLEFTRCGQPAIPPHHPVLDPLRLERLLTRRSLGATYERYMGRPLEGAHDAEADTLAMVEVLRRQRQVHAHRLPSDLRGLVDLASAAPPRRAAPCFYEEPPGTLRFAFGRHRGRSAAEHPDYLAWMLQAGFDEEAKETVRRLLASQGRAGAGAAARARGPTPGEPGLRPGAVAAGPVALLAPRG